MTNIARRYGLVGETHGEPIEQIRDAHSSQPKGKTLDPTMESAAPKKKAGGRPRIEDRDKTNEAKKPWLTLGMSRASWYRRQAEKRKEQAK
jgi:hypothetical protein